MLNFVPHVYTSQVQKISQANVTTEIVFNCQMGRGRTTTGMVIATLIYINRIGASGDLLLLFVANFVCKIVSSRVI